jgi:hypothetical protein
MAFYMAKVVSMRIDANAMRIDANAMLPGTGSGHLVQHNLKPTVVTAKP